MLICTDAHIALHAAFVSPLCAWYATCSTTLDQSPLSLGGGSGWPGGRMEPDWARASWRLRVCW